MLRLIHSFESDPATQLRFHGFMTVFWLLTMVAALIINRPHDTASWVAQIILEVSLYANFATDYGAMSSAIAGVQTAPAHLGSPYGGTPVDPITERPVAEQAALEQLWDDVDETDWLFADEQPHGLPHNLEP